MIVIYEYSYLYFVLTICKISLNTIGRILNGLFMFVCFRLQFRCSLALHLFKAFENKNLIDFFFLL